MLWPLGVWLMSQYARTETELGSVPRGWSVYTPEAVDKELYTSSQVLGGGAGGGGGDAAGGGGDAATQVHVCAAAATPKSLRPLAFESLDTSASAPQKCPLALFLRKLVVLRRPEAAPHWHMMLGGMQSAPVVQVWAAASCSNMQNTNTARMSPCNTRDVATSEGMTI
jgi:hypothetical protein